MKFWIVCLAVSLVGGLGGIGLSLLDYQRKPVDFGPLDWNLATSDSTTSADRPSAMAVVVNGEEFNFGTMPRETTRYHSFVLRNDGEVPLLISIADTTCHCTVGELDEDEVPPGGTTQVTLTWTAEGYDRDFRQSATLRTNDPQRPSIDLSIVGQVMQVIRPEPMTLALSQVSRSENREAQLRVYGYRDADLQVRSLRFLEAATAEYFEATIQPLSAAELAREPDARSGVLVRIQLSPGLPLGPLMQRLRLEFTASDLGILTIPIQANVISDVSVVAGRYFDRDRNLVRLGQVPQRHGKSTTLQVMVKGPRRDEIELTVGEIEPADVLTASFGTPRSINDGAVLMYPLTVQVPGGSRLATHLSIDPCCHDTVAPDKPGRIQLKMTNTDAPELMLYVSFVVVEG